MNTEKKSLIRTIVRLFQDDSRSRRIEETIKAQSLVEAFYEGVPMLRM